MTRQGSSGGTQLVPAVALIDGEHYPPVVVDALSELGSRYRFVAALFLGGTEKIQGGGGARAGADDGGEGTGGAVHAAASELYGLPVHFVGRSPSDSKGPRTGAAAASALAHVIARYRPGVVVDVSDEPVVGYRERFRLISQALALDVSYEGSDFRFSPPRLDRLATNPSLSIIGTAKRVGKTALSGFVARTIQEHLAEVEKVDVGGAGRSDVVIVPMGRGGPRSPEVIDGAGRLLDARDLLEWSRAGRHAASDHFEDAALSRVTTVGCRRCGGGMAGQPFVSNVAEGARVANDLLPSLTIFEGSGAAVPPVRTDARLLVAGAHQPPEYVAGYLGTYRVLVSDAVVLTMAEEPLAGSEQVERIVAEVDSIRPGIPVIPVVFRPRPQGDVRGRRVALFSTAPAVQGPVLARYLEERHGCEVVSFSPHLSDRERLRVDLARAEVDGADVFLTEIKAAAIDVVAEEADRRGVATEFIDNVPVETGSARAGDLEEMCRRLAALAVERYEA